MALNRFGAAALAAALLAVSQPAAAQDDSTVIVKKGWNFGALPTISFDTDLGLQYGALVNFYYYGDGSSYPEYRHSLYAEVSRYTKGSGINRFFYDSKYLIPGCRVTTDLSYLTEQALSFYGFNGAAAVYRPEFVDPASPLYRSRLFYSHSRSILRFTTDLQRGFGQSFRWIAGVAFYDYKVGSLDLERLNRGKSDGDALPDTPSLYDLYRQWGVIPDNEADGGAHLFLKGGLVYDTRDNEPNPFRGVYTEAVLSFSPGMGSAKGNTHMKGAVIHRQYFTLVPQRLTFAYRLMYQATIFGRAPFYTQSYLTTTYLRAANNEGLGGAKSMRGLLRNRVVGDDVALANVELRSRLVRFRFINQNFYLGLNLFADGGMVTRGIDYDRDAALLRMAAQNPGLDPADFFDDNRRDRFHLGYGLGARIVMNENFVVAVDYGRSMLASDGSKGIYIGLNYMF